MGVIPEDCVYDRNPVVESLHMSIHTVGQELDQTMNRRLVVL